MHFLTAAAVTCLAFVVVVTAARGSLLPIQKYKGDTSGKYIVKLKQGASRRIWIEKLHLGEAIEWENFNSFTSHININSLNTLRASEDVDGIFEDGLVHAMSAVVQTDAPWGLERISSLLPPTNQNTAALTFTYTYDDSAGSCADIYIVDTGIYLEHHEFTGRAFWGYSANNYSHADGNGHGTHVAGIAAGTHYGVAKKARLYSVIVLSPSGSGSISDVISGLNWIASNVKKTGRPSVVNISLGGSASSALDNAIASLTSSGIHVVVVAGNSNTDAGSTSPARAPSAITVGATTITDARTSSSNYGPVIDIFAPGQNIISAWISGPDSTNTLSGTSMAAGYVSGLVAYLACKDGNITAAQVIANLHAYSLKGVLSGIPSDTVNELAHNAPH